MPLRAHHRFREAKPVVPMFYSSVGPRPDEANAVIVHVLMATVITTKYGSHGTMDKVASCGNREREREMRQGRRKRRETLEKLAARHCLFNIYQPLCR